MIFAVDIRCISRIPRASWHSRGRWRLSCQREGRSKQSCFANTLRTEQQQAWCRRTCLLQQRRVERLTAWRVIEEHTSQAISCGCQAAQRSDRQQRQHMADEARERERFGAARRVDPPTIQKRVVFNIRRSF